MAGWVVATGRTLRQFSGQAKLTAATSINFICMSIKPKSWLAPKSQVRSRHLAAQCTQAVYICTSKARANCKQVQVQCSLECYARAGAVLQRAVLGSVGMRPEQRPCHLCNSPETKTNKIRACRSSGMQRYHVPGGENALKKSGRHWNAAKCIQKRFTMF